MFASSLAVNAPLVHMNNTSGIILSGDQASYLITMFHVGVFNREDPPVPIPNTAVKLTCAHDTWMATSWENRSMPTLVSGQSSLSAENTSKMRAISSVG